ncbi:hypothetical protein SAMN02745866_03040 [Alteromonadaceae bacterium Bs31]|nr:hypothetical protein SAMN02745866_03040 [Alteromonadaceae bacterium Bs31]
MDELRIFLSIVCFFTGCYTLYDLLASGFDIFVFIICPLSFILAHYLWPPNSKDSPLLDLIEIIIDLPFKIIRTLVSSLRSQQRDSDGPDIDF